MGGRTGPPCKPGGQPGPGREHRPRPGVDGVEVSSGSTVKGNNCNNNGSAGIHATSSDNRIEGNNVTSNTGPGFDVDVGGSIIIKNTASGNGQNYAQIAAGNAVGQVLTTSTTFTNTNAWANFSY